MNDLQVSHERRNSAMENMQAAQLSALREKCAAEVAELKCKQKNEYDALVSVHCTAPRAEDKHSRVCTARV